MTVTTAQPQTIADLAATVAGPVFRPGDAAYESECAGFNLAVQHRPAVVVGAACADDVAAAVAFAAANGMPVGVQATGHGAIAPMAGGVLVSTARMADVHIDPDTAIARVGAGVRWGQVLEAAAPYGLAGLCGSSPNVGVVGYTTGGGLGPLARTFGFAADHVVAVEIVTGDGVLRRATAEQDEELFWAVRGGKGNVGIVTALEFRLLPLATIYGGGIMYPGEFAPAVLHAWREWTSTLDERTTSSIALLRLPDLPDLPPPLRGQFVVHLRVGHVGDELSGSAAVQPMRDVAPAIMDSLGVMPYAAIGAIHQDPEHAMPAWDASTLLHELPVEAVEAVLSLAGPGVDTPILMVELRHLGGAVAREPFGGNAVPGRDGAFTFNVISVLPPPLAEVVPAVGRGMLAAMAPWSLDRSLVNFSGHRVAANDVAAIWSPDKLQRLRAVKRAYDPDNLFRFGSSFGAA